MKKLIFGLAVAGVLFSGYLSAVRLFTDTCALSEPCPYFLGFPACYYGFVMFCAIAYFSRRLVFVGGEEKSALQSICTISLIGIIFAGYFTLRELPVLVDRGVSAFALKLPTCALGFIFYILVFILSFRLYSKFKKAGRPL